MIADEALHARIGSLLEALYLKRLAALDRLTLGTLLAKNPYLYRALGIANPSDFIEQLLIARSSSSDETIFGNDFFEPLALFAANARQTLPGEWRSVTPGAAAGQDIAIETATEYLAIAVKSGTNIFNSQSEKGQSTEFQQLQARLKKLGKMFRPIIGYGYGRKASAKVSPTERVAGQQFWALLTGEDDFYLRISRAMSPFADQHGSIYSMAFEQKHRQLLREFMLHFVDGLGNINWDAVVAYNSASQKPKITR